MTKLTWAMRIAHAIQWMSDVQKPKPMHSPQPTSMKQSAQATTNAGDPWPMWHGRCRFLLSGISCPKYSMAFLMVPILTQHRCHPADVHTYSCMHALVDNVCPWPTSLAWCWQATSNACTNWSVWFNGTHLFILTGVNVFFSKDSYWICTIQIWT